MRVQQWEQVNTGALAAVNRGDHGVELIYLQKEDDRLLTSELERLVAAEQKCCGDAGVKFELSTFSDGYRVNVSVVREGLPADTVIAAFAAMSP